MQLACVYRICQNRIINVSHIHAMNNRTQGYISSLFAEHPLPRVDVGLSSRSSFDRHTAPGVTAFFRLAPPTGQLPYGATARLVAAWLATQLTWNKEPEVVFGEPELEFVHKLAAGRETGCGHICDQMFWLSKMCLSVRKHRQRGTLHRQKQMNYAVTVRACTRWNLGPDGKSTESCEMELTLLDTFFEDLLTRRIPVDLGVYAALQHSPLAMDLYAWLRLHLGDLRESGRPLRRVPWDVVTQQLGCNDADAPEGADEFLKNCQAHLAEVLDLCSDTANQVRNLGDAIELSC